MNSQRLSLYLELTTLVHACMSRSQNFDFQVCADGLFLSSLFLQLFVSCLVCFEECR